MFLLDTDVVAELMKAAPEPTVVQWIDSLPIASVFVSALSQAEILYGITSVPAGRRQDGLVEAVRIAFETYFHGRILPFDSVAAPAFAQLAEARRALCRPIAQVSAQIAAIALSRGADLATRNVADFEGCGFRVINPWAPTFS